MAGNRHLGSYIVFKNILSPLKSLQYFQSQHIINAIEYLYKSRIIHRDLRPQNLILDESNVYAKLIDFGFATIFETNKETKRLPIEGVISYGGLKFLEHCAELFFKAATLSFYEYERTFDLPCAINIIMYMTNNSIKNQLTSFKRLQTIHERIAKSREYWLQIKGENKNYAHLLNLIHHMEKSPNFDLIKQEIRILHDKSK
ncbi:unnamed protein product [Rotaria magnacalcarata]|uniref:Protein kinase domain-containing protein n=1 Tax=Rotaria magnacalcarata TaxID=392030 RepID=A0A8S2KLG9_9BILA|nr:unnamed protein product [Rotaria magnacalcarata]